jgi:hypothetical protein
MKTPSSVPSKPLTADDLPLGLGPLSDEDYEALVEAVEEMSQPVTPPKPTPTPKDPPIPGEQSRAHLLGSAGASESHGYDRRGEGRAGVVETGETIEMHFQASQTIPKARVVFARKDISLDEEFVEKIEDACNKDDIQELLNLLERNGQFVPLSITLGGRIIITESKTVASQSAFDTQKDELRAAATGRYVYDGVTIKGDAAAGIGKEHERENKLTIQQKSMTMVTIGGDGREATSQTDELGTHWIDTVAPFLGWKTIGFEPRALVPIIEFLDKKYADKCKDMLRKHFVAHLGGRLEQDGWRHRRHNIQTRHQGCQPTQEFRREPRWQHRRDETGL